VPLNRSTLNGFRGGPGPDLDLDLDPEPPLGNFQNLKLEHSNQWVRWSTVWQKLIKHKPCTAKKRTQNVLPQRTVIPLLLLFKEKAFLSL
jgi:hypothetical protein